MKIRTMCLGLAIGVMVSVASFPGTGTCHAQISAGGRSVITGTIYGDSNRPVADVWVELLDDFNATVNRMKTDASGRFGFRGLLNGNYRVRVLPYGTDYKEQTQDVTLVSMSAVPGRPGADRQILDIYLKPNERSTSGPFAVGPGAIFVQVVPAEAQKLYDEGHRALREKRDNEGLAKLKSALEVFPTYFLALDRLGGEYAMRGHKDRSYWEAALVLFEKAVEINPRGVNTLFGLGWTQYQLGLIPQAVVSFERTTSLYAKAADAFLWLGRAQRRAAALDKAELALKRANEMTNGKASEVHKELAILYSDQKRYEEAAHELELYLKTQRDKADEAKIHELIKQMRAKAGAAGA